MEASTIFYITGIIYFVAWIALLIFLGVLGWKAYKYLLALPQEIQDRVEAKVKSLIPSDKNKVMGMVGTIAVPFILARVKSFFKRK